jgi:LmbE family N-acetylglucosaminyl deacetylase
MIRALVAFGQSRYVRPGFDLSGRTVEQVRHAEELRFADRIGMVVSIGSLPDTSLRGGGDRKPAVRAMREGARELIEEQVKGFRPSIILAPAAIGSHADHIAVRDAAVSFQQPNLPVFLYEDLPYAVGREQQWTILKRRPMRIMVSSCIRQKAHALSLYRSQFARHDIDRVIAHAFSCGDGIAAERLYATRAGRSILRTHEVLRTR